MMKTPHQAPEVAPQKRLTGPRSALGLLMLAALAVSLLWPQDHFWGKPEAWRMVFWNYPEQIETIRTALQANQYRQPAVHGVRGSIPVIYHPFHVWIYQLLLCLTSEPTALVLIKQSLTLVPCLLGLAYLARALAWPAHPVLLFFFSPFLYAYGRQLSDDPWLIPLSLLAFCCYARFYRRRKWPAAVAGLAALILMFFTHPRGLPPALAMLVLFLLLEYRWVKKRARPVLLVLALALVVTVPTLLDLHRQINPSAEACPASTADSVRAALPPTDPGTISRLNLIFPLISGGLFFSYDFMTLFPETVPWSVWLPKPLVRALVAVSMAAYLLIIIGLWLTASRLVSFWRGRRPPDLADRIGLICLAMVILQLAQTAVVLALKKFSPPDYHLGVWFCYFFFIWRAMGFFSRGGRGRLLPPVYLTAMAVLWVNMVLTVHVRSDFNLGQAVRLARDLAGHSPQSDIVLLVDFTAEAGRELQALETRADQVLMGFYYGPYLRETRGFIDKMRRHRGNLLSYALYPLTLHYRQAAGGTTNQTPRTLLIKWEEGSLPRRLILVDDPEAVFQKPCPLNLAPNF